MPHPLVERTHSIDVRELHRDGAFSGTLTWFPFPRLKTRRFKVEFRGARWPAERRTQVIPVTWTRCHFGGMRPWFVCACGKRAAKLYPGILEFYCCRTCANLAYESQRRGRKSRHYHKAQIIRRRLWDEGRPGVDAMPKLRRWMRKKTFARRIASLASVERIFSDGKGFRPRKRRRTSCE